MKAWQLGGSGGIDGIARVERPVPAPRRGEVLVRLHAASLNYLDLMVLDGRYARRPAAGLVPLSDGAGAVAALGEGVTLWQPGDRVAGTFFPRWIGGPLPPDGRSDQPGASRDGMAAEFAIFDQEALVAIPPPLSYAEASTLPCAGVTAWASLFGPRPLRPGEVVLTQGGGGVSVFAVQLARLAGARVIATTSDDARAERLKALGAHEVINHRRTPDWAAAVRGLTGGAGADHIVEIGGAGTLPQSIAAAAWEAQIAMVGVLETSAGVDPGIFMRGVTTIRRITVGSRADFIALNRAVALHAVHPVVDRIFPFADLPAAYRHLAARRHLGKVVLAID